MCPPVVTGQDRPDDPGKEPLAQSGRRAKAAPEFPGDRGQLVAAIPRKLCPQGRPVRRAPLPDQGHAPPARRLRCGVLGVRSRCSAVPMFAKPPRRPRRRLAPCVFFPNRRARTPQGFAEVGKRRLLKVGQRAERHIAESLPDVLKGYAFSAWSNCSGLLLEGVRLHLGGWPIESVAFLWVILVGWSLR